MSPLHAAASIGSVECVNVLLEHGAFLSSRFVAKFSFLLLMSGVACRWATCLGDDVNERHDDMSALHLAAFYGRVDMLKLLISKGCQVSWCSRYESRTISILRRCRLPTRVVYPNITSLDRRSGETPLHRAAVRGHTECVRVLLDSGAVIDAKYQPPPLIIDIRLASKAYALLLGKKQRLDGQHALAPGFLLWAN